jgi:aspartate racemase
MARERQPSHVTKTIGLIGGMSWESSAEYYRIINQEMKWRLGGHHNARSVMVTIDFAEAVDAATREAWDELAGILMPAAQQLVNAGADFFLLCANTPHKIASTIESAVPIPFLHIADAAAASIISSGLSTVALLGTRFTMEEDFYSSRLKRFGVEVVTPEPEERIELQRIIIDELCHGKVLPDSKRFCEQLVDKLERQHAKGVILGCTELPMVITRDTTKLPLFDTTHLHAEAAVEKALEGIQIRSTVGFIAGQP